MKRGRVNPRSKKQAAKDREFLIARNAVLERDEHTCQLYRRMDGHHCTGRLEVHHKLRRSQGGGHDLDNLATLCTSGHLWVHANPAEAALFGLLLLRPEVSE